MEVEEGRREARVQVKEELINEVTKRKRKKRSKNAGKER